MRDTPAAIRSHVEPTTSSQSSQVMGLASVHRIGPHSSGIRMTRSEFDAADAEPGHRYELIDGVLVVSPPPGIGERDPNEELGYLLRQYRDAHPEGSALDGTVPEQEIRTGRNVRRADRAIWVGLRRVPHPRRDIPAIVVEFVSEGRRDWQRDYVDNRREYLDAGVVEYWVIDRFRRRMTVYQRPETGVAEQVVTESDLNSTPLLPGFELPVERLLAIADRWTTDDDERTV